MRPLPIIAEDDETTKVAPDGRPVCSPSQHGKSDQCDAAWGFHYLEGLKVTKPSAAKGVEMHERLEHYFKSGELPQSDEIGSIALSGIKYLPHRNPMLEIEYYFAQEMNPRREANSPGYWERGKIDVYDRMGVGQYQPEHQLGVHSGGKLHPFRYPWPRLDSKGRPYPVVLDHKSTGDFKWMKTDLQLRGSTLVKADPQPAIYGTVAVLDFLDSYGELPDWVYFRWVYYSTKKGDLRAKAVDLRMTPAEIEGNYAQWKPDYDKIARFRASGLTSGNQLEKRGGEACLKFGGCDYGPKYLNVCHLSSGQRFKSAMMNNTPLSMQVNAMLAQNGQAVPQATGGMFGTAPATMSAPQPQAQPQQTGMFATQPIAQQPTQPTLAATGGMFAQQGPATGGMFAAQTVAPPAAQAPATGMFATQLAPAQVITQAPAPAAQGMAAFMGGQTAQTVAQQPIDPRINDLPSDASLDKKLEWLKHCDNNQLDHKTGQPKALSAGAAPVSIPAVQGAAPSQQAQDEANAAVFKQQATAIYNEGRAPNQGTHPEVTKFFSALVAINGAKTQEQLAAANGQLAASPDAAPKQRRKRRSAAEIQAANAQAGGVASPLQHPDVINVIREFRDFLDSLLPAEG